MREGSPLRVHVHSHCSQVVAVGQQTNVRICRLDERQEAHETPTVCGRDEDLLGRRLGKARRLVQSALLYRSVLLRRTLVRLRRVRYCGRALELRVLLLGATTYRELRVLLIEALQTWRQTRRRVQRGRVLLVEKMLRRYAVCDALVEAWRLLLARRRRVPRCGSVVRLIELDRVTLRKATQ